MCRYACSLKWESADFKLVCETEDRCGSWLLLFSRHKADILDLLERGWKRGGARFSEISCCGGWRGGGECPRQRRQAGTVSISWTENATWKQLVLTSASAMAWHIQVHYLLAVLWLLERSFKRKQAYKRLGEVKSGQGRDACCWVWVRTQCTIKLVISYTLWFISVEHFSSNTFVFVKLEELTNSRFSHRLSCKFSQLSHSHFVIRKTFCNRYQVLFVEKCM